uniref:Periaxin n=1 Tax=Cacopsylla melanoneura TaxID=428564 RepID=A0A8D9BCL2_9HEMI
MASKRHLLLLSSLIASTAAQVESSGSTPEECLTSSSVVWAVLGTIMILLAISVGAYALWRYYWRSRKGEHLVLVTADAEKGDKFAFDNQAFKEGTPISRTLEANKLKGIKWPEFVSAQNGNAKTRSMDDSCVGQDPAKNIVPLRSHDFTGLGFNIYGNMRDGIYIKDVSHRGPAMESGRIQPGDRITSVRISFHHMVYEDALTILSYASPYEVQIETENGSGRVNSRPSTLLRNKQAPSSTPGERIVHPFFRSQSISDLTQISSKPPSKRTSMNSHHNTSHLSAHDPNDKPAVLEVTPTTVKQDKGHKFGVRVLPDMKPEGNHLTAAPQPVVLTIENEKQNSHMYFEHNKMQHKSHHENQAFDEIDLSDKSQAIDEPDCKTQRANTPSPTTNVKSIIAKGLQNLKGKLPHHKKQSSLDNTFAKQASTPPESCVIDMNPNTNNQRAEETIVTDRPEENKVETNAQHIMKTFLEKEKAHTADLKAPIPISVVNKTDSFSSTEGDGSKRSKRKAPAPPVTTDVELHAEPTENISSRDSDSEMGDSSSTTIELNSSHITVHHIPDDSDRRAASLGDLSKMTHDEVPAVSVLERAMSLELADGNSNPRDSKKRKAPHPPPDEMTLDEGSFAKEPRIEAGLGLASLKKASLFGTMEEAIQQTDEDSDSLISPTSGQSSPDIPEISDGDLVSSTPMKVSNVEIKTVLPKEEITNTVQTRTFIEIKEQEKPQPAQRTITETKIETIEITNARKLDTQDKENTMENGQDDVVENGHFIKDIIGDFSQEMNGEFSKGMNGVWHESAAVKETEQKPKDWELTESPAKDAYLTALNISVEDKPPDLPSSPPPNMNSFVTEIKVRNRLDDNDDEDEILDISDKDMTLLEQECDDSKIFKNGVYFTTDESLLMNGSMSPFSKSSLMSSPSETNRATPPSKIENFINNSKTTPDVNLSDEQILALKTSTNKLTSNLYKTNSESPSPNKRRIPSKSPSPSSGKSPLRGNISITSIKSSGSRIPVRAFSNNSSSSSSTASDTSSTSPRSISMIPDPKVRKSRKPDEPDQNQNARFSYSSSFTVSPINKSNVPSPERRYNGTNGTTESSVIMVDNQK